MIHTTAHHPFCDQTSNTWVNATELTPGHQLHITDGTTTTITAVDVRLGEHDMHDLTVDTIHTRIV